MLKYKNIFKLEINSNIYYIHDFILKEITVFEDIINGNINDNIKMDLPFSDTVINTLFGILYGHENINSIKLTDQIEILKLMDYFVVNEKYYYGVNFNVGDIDKYLKTISEADIQFVLRMIPYLSTCDSSDYVRMSYNEQKYINRIYFCPYCLYGYDMLSILEYQNPIEHLLKIRVDVKKVCTKCYHHPSDSYVMGIVSVCEKLINIYDNITDKESKIKLLSSLILNEHVLDLIAKTKTGYCMSPIFPRFGYAFSDIQDYNYIDDKQSYLISRRDLVIKTECK